MSKTFKRRIGYDKLFILVYLLISIVRTRERGPISMRNWVVYNVPQLPRLRLRPRMATPWVWLRRRWVGAIDWHSVRDRPWPGSRWALLLCQQKNDDKKINQNSLEKHFQKTMKINPIKKLINSNNFSILV